MFHIGDASGTVGARNAMAPENFLVTTATIDPIINTETHILFHLKIGDFLMATLLDEKGWP